MAIQDDGRENELRELFGLYKAADQGRSGVDAYMQLDGIQVPFELKSTTRGSVTTVRDFGPDHIEKWVDKHWLIGVYDRRTEKLKYAIYGSPAMMAPWIKEKAEYISLDFQLADLVPSLMTGETMQALLPTKASYTIKDAKCVQKKQHTVAEYRGLMDIKNGYTPGRMLEILKSRCAYLIRRGSTLNNPHIPESYFKGAEWPRLKPSDADQLPGLVRKALEFTDGSSDQINSENPSA